METLIARLAAKYELTPLEIRQEIEAVLGAYLSQRYRQPVLVFSRSDRGLAAEAYGLRDGVIQQHLLHLLAQKDLGLLRRQLEASLARVATNQQMQQYRLFKARECSLVWGIVSGRDAEDNFYIEIEPVAGQPLIAICPLNRIGVHERYGDRFTIGRRRAFHLRRVEAVMVDDTPRLRVVVDRVSKYLVINLLREQLGEEGKGIKLHCLLRYVGQRSVVESNRYLPKKVILSVDRELRERVEVKLIRKRS